MMRAVLGASLRFRLLVVGIAAAVVVAGVVKLRDASVDALPEYTLPYVEVQTESLGLSAAEVEQMITVPLEQDLLNGVKGVDTIRSDSVPGLSSIVLVFERGTDILRARQLVQERLSQPNAFPNVSKPPLMLQPVSTTGRVMMVGLSSDRLSPIDLSVLARWTVRPRLMGVEGVANVAIWGQRERQLQVQVDPRRLRDRGVSLLQVIETTGNSQLVSPLSFLDASTPGTGGFIDGPNQRLGVRHVLPFGKPADLAQIPIEDSGLRIGDVATVVEDHQPLIGDAVVDGRAGLQLVVEKLPAANTLKVTRDLERAIDELRPGMAGVHVDSTVFRPASFLETALDNLRLALLLGAGLVAAALVAGLRRPRAAVVCLAVGGTSLLAALLVLTGLVVALGAVLGDAVGDVEHVERRMADERRTGVPRAPARVVLQAASERRAPMGYATVALLLVIVPVLLAGGASGAFVHPLAVTYALAVLASLVAALTVTPALSLLLLARAPRPRRRRSPAATLAAGYAWALTRFVRTPRPAVLTLAALAVAGVALLPTLGHALRPAMKDRDVLVHWDAAASTSLAEMDRITSRAVRELRAVPGVESVGAHVGRAVASDQVSGAGSGELWLRIAASAGYDATLGAIRDVVRGYPGLRSEVLTYEDERAKGAFAPADDGLTVRVYGQEYRVLRREAEALRGVVGGVDGVRAPRVELPASQPTLQVEADLPAARRHGVKPGDIRRAAATLVSGLEVGNFFEDQKVFQVMVQGVPTTRHSVQAVRGLLLDTPGGGHVRLDKVADVRLVANPTDIRHDAVARYVDLRAAIAGRDPSDVRRDVQARLRAHAMPLEYHAEVVDKPADERGGPGLLTLGLVATVGIFLVLQAAFGSWRLATLLAVTLPVALVGGEVVALADGSTLGLGEVAGLIAVLGVALRNGVGLLTGFQRMQRPPGANGGPPLHMTGALEQAGPVALSAIVLAAAVLPFAILGDVAGNEITHMTALVILGGLVTTTLTSLLVLPALFLHFGLRAAAPAHLPSAPATAPVPVPQLEHHL